MDTLKLFSYRSEYQPVDKGDLVNGGVSDSGQCYYDGTILSNWEQGQVPLAEHAKWHTECPHIHLVKGQANMEESNFVAKEENFGFFTDGGFNSEHSYIESVAAQSCLEMGFLRENVETAISIFLQRHGHSDFKGADLCQILFEIEEAEDYITAESPDNLQDHSLTQKQICDLCVASLDHVSYEAFNHVLGCPQCFPWFLTLPVHG